MSEPNFIPDPGNNSEDSPFDFSALTPENTEPLGTFEPPVVRKDKPGWWGSRKKNDSQEKPAREKKAASIAPMPRGGIAAPMAALYVKTGKLVKTWDVGCGNILIVSAEDCGKAWEELAKRNPQVRRVILALLNTSAMGDLMIAHAPIFAAVAIHHVPVVRTMMEKMAGDAAEMFAKMAAEENGE